MLALRSSPLSSTVLVVALALLFVLLPDGAVVVHRVLTPSRFSDDVEQVAYPVRDCGECGHRPEYPLRLGSAVERDEHLAEG